MTPDSPPFESVIAAVFREHRQRLWQFFLRGAGAPDTAEDLLQETFLRVWDHRDDLGSSEPTAVRERNRVVRQYLWRVARNLMIDEIRSRQRSRVRTASREESVDTAPSSNPAPAQAVELDQCLRVMHEVVDRLPNERSRRCLQFWLRGRSLVDIADDLGLGAGQVRGLIQRAKNEVILRAGDRMGVAGEASRGRS